jgi:hypothetical protein
VVGALEPHHLEGERFLAEILRGAEPNRQIDLPEGLDLLAGATPWNGFVLGCSWSNLIPSKRNVCA